MNKLLAIGLCLSMLLCFSACANGNAASSQDGSESSLALPEGAPEDAEVHTARDGVKTIFPAPAEETSSSAAPPAPEVTPDTVWQEDQTVTYHSYTPPDKAVLDEEDCIGILSIPVIELEVKAIDPGTSDMLSVMDRGAAHFAVSSAWDGNVALSAHNATADGSPAYFKDLHKLEIGDELYYTTALGERRYEVASIETISESDWSYVIDRPDDNRVTLITCVTGQPEKRLMIQAVEAVE